MASGSIGWDTSIVAGQSSPNNQPSVPASSESSSTAYSTPKSLQNDAQVRKKLPYFHRELPEHEKELIGDITPKKIESPPPPAALETVVQTKPDGSPWNNAGTWEDKDMTPWAKTYLEGLLLPHTCTVGGHTIEVEAVTAITGHAHRSVVRGKARYIYDLALDLPWQCKSGAITHKGVVKLQDICNDCDGEYAVEVTCKDPRPPDRLYTVLRQYLSKTLPVEVASRMQVFEKDFQQRR